MGIMCIICGLTQSDCKDFEEFQQHDCMMMKNYYKHKAISGRVKRKQSKEITRKIIDKMEK